MSVIIKGVYENGQVSLIEPAPTDKKVAVAIVFPQDADETKNVKKSKIHWGSLAGKISVPEDFTDEIDDLKEYMQV